MEFTDKELEVLWNLVNRRLKNDQKRLDNLSNQKSPSSEHIDMLTWKMNLLRALLDKLERMRLAA